MSKSKHNRRTKAKPKAASARPIILPLAAVCSAPYDLLGKLDIAALNLMCASGLPGAEKLDYDQAYDWLGRAAHRVDLAVRRCLGEFRASPRTFHHSFGFFCCHMLLQVLQEHCGVRYNPNRAVDPTWQDRGQVPDFRDSRDLFIHGIIDGPGGTCGSIPVVYVAVGRRLGLPLRLVEARGHLFFRWDDPLGLKSGKPDRINIEGTGHGISAFPDEYYRTWPEPWTAEEKKANCYLRSLTPKQELASFLGTRAACLEDNQRFDEAVQAYRWACGLTPNDARPRNNLQRLIWKLQKDVFEMNDVVAMQRQQRETARRADPMYALTRGHPANCPCPFCEQERRPTGRPDHSPNCFCHDCRSRRTRSSQAVGHPPQCGCGRCRTPSPF